jgi:methylmalonyl-CoA mutase cobalamin-binding subunit
MKASNDFLLIDSALDGPALVSQGKDLGNQVTMGISSFCRFHGVTSELDYKLKMAQAGRTMTSLTIGLTDWPETKKGLHKIWQETADRGFYVDRFIIALDRRMGLPPEFRAGALKETGPMLNSDAEWDEVAQSIQIQPHMGDMMIGSPSSLDNTRRAIEAGVNYIGNLSQFAWKYPGWPGDDVAQMSEVVKALGLMASKAAEGAVVHSYLDDGFPAQFGDYSSYIGWAKFERYVVEELIGAKLAHAYGGLTHDPITKTVVTMAIESLRPKGVCSSFYFGNTTRYTQDIEQNYGVLGVDVLYMMLADRHLRAGSSIMPVPVTEAIRVPTAEEIIDVQTIAHHTKAKLDSIYEVTNWQGLEVRSQELVKYGNQFFDNLLNGLSDLGVDIKDPLKLLLAVRRLGPSQLEKRFGVGTPTEDPVFDGYEPLVATDVLKDFLSERSRIREVVRPANWILNKSHKPVIASSDVHEIGMRLVIDAVESLDIKPVIGTVGIDPDELAELALKENATAVLISTHNGMALSYAKALLFELNLRSISPQVIIGGRLNQEIEGEDMPVDVTDQLIDLGIDVCFDLKDLASLIRN